MKIVTLLQVWPCQWRHPADPCTLSCLCICMTRWQPQCIELVLQSAVKYCKWTVSNIAKRGLRLHVFPNDKVAALSDLETQSYMRSNKPDRQGFHPFRAFLEQLISSSQWNVSGFIKSTAYICTSEVFGICCTSAIAFLMSASSGL